MGITPHTPPAIAKTVGASSLRGSGPSSSAGVSAAPRARTGLQVRTALHSVSKEENPKVCNNQRSGHLCSVLERGMEK